MQKCRFCGSNVIVPSGVIQNSNLFGRAGSADYSDLSALTGKALKIGEIQHLLQGGNKIQAIKVFRETFGVGLKEAKDAVEAIERGESLDLSRMAVQNANAPQNLQSNAANQKLVKKAGMIFGGSILASFIIPIIFVFVFVIAIFFIVRSVINNTLDKVSTLKSIPSTPAPPTKNAKNAPAASIAQELLKFGGEGTGAGKFTDNRTIAVDPEGRIYSADFSGGRIQVFDAAGNFQTQITADTTRTVDALAADRKGNLFVLQGYDVFRINRETGETLGKYRVDMASDMALGLDGKIYVAGHFGGITVLSADGARLKTIQISKDLNLDYLQQIAVDGSGDFYLLDGKNYAVFKLSPDGKLLTRFGGKASVGAGSASRATFSAGAQNLAIDSQGRLYVSEVTRIAVFDPNGNFLNDFATTQAFGMTFNDKDELFVAARPFVIKYKLSF
jgi:hypothetical protein